MTTKKPSRFTSDNQPSGRAKRGKSPRTRVLEALKRSARTEDEFWDLLVARSLDPDDSIALKEVLARLSPIEKATMPKIEFKFNARGTPSEQAGQILKAASDGVIAPDLAQIFISSIASIMKIEEVAEIAQRLTEIEKSLGINNG